jgi:hypothetical protein
MKVKRSLSGIYFRYQNPESGRWENWCFEDLPEVEQNNIMNNHSREWIENLAKSLSNTINTISEQFDITAEKE